ncbi:MAG: hypothetical protein IT364_10665 [Candidatus Hydrogenedentes bacterium]|nr:hypothetical protein [Candidatus Hydrogenedentota bacterium]
MPKSVGHLEFPDMLIIAGYFVLMLGIGAYFYNRMRHIKDYFSGGNNIPWWLSGVSFYMSSFSVAAFVFYPGLCYRHGWVGVTLLWVAIPATIFSVTLFGVRWRRARIDSPVEYIETRYSSFLRQLFAWHGVPVKLVDDGIKLFATGTFISVCTGLRIEYSVLAAGGIILISTFLGGLWAVTVTDFIQFVVLMAGVLILLPLSIQRAGGMGEVLSKAPEGFFRLTSEEFGWSYVIPVILLYALAWSSINWSLIQRYYCVPKEKDALKVGWTVVALYAIGPPLMFFPAIAANQFMPGVEDAGQIYPLLCTQLLPAGMLGLIVAAMFAATMSTLSSDYNVCASVLTNDVYRRLFRPLATQGELVQVGRIMTIVFGLFALGVGLLMSRGKSEDQFRTMVTLFGLATAPVAIPMLLGLVSRRVTNAGAVAGCLAGLLAGLLVWQLGPKDEAMIAGVAIKMEIVLLFATSAVTLSVLAVVSVLAPARAEAQERTDAFLARAQTPIGQLPEDVVLIEKKDVFSPFRVVGVSVLCIGVLLLLVLPWISGRMDLLLAGGTGLLLAVVGGAVALASKPRTAP